MAYDWFTHNWPAMVTPMHDDGRLRLESVPLLIEKFIEEEAGGVYLCGSTGQGPLLTVEERKAIAEAAVRTAAGRLPVMVHVGAIRVEDAVELARHCGEIGADAVSSVVPMYYPPTLSSSMEHYRRIASASELPFYAYSFAIPNSTVESYVEALMQVPHARGLKFTSLNMYELTRLKIASGGRLNVLSGADESYLAAQAQGADGAIGSTQNVAIRLFAAVEESAVSGRWEEARHRMQLAVQLVHEVTIGCNLASLHTILTREGIPCGQPRHPLPHTTGDLAERAWQAYRRVMGEAGL
ncbi:MAG: dihydrodipicolinate synthase/N-acetylneuraminate lyase [Armatimonadetes bacterium]|jgi:N-acetylneuraminate lyase|nr:dihydrodipicolinate synthase/N-acetylneuraminate lyase [Armatimonadota bacterium]